MLTVMVSDAGTVFSLVRHVGGKISADSEKQPMRQSTSIKTGNQAAAGNSQVCVNLLSIR
jgi:hypothetical protein